MSEISNSKVGYPILEINLKKVYENVKNVVDMCKDKGISVAGVVKGFNALPKVVEQFVAAGCDYIADSRLDQIIDLKESGINKPFMLIRIPMLSEIHEMIRYADISLNSELYILKKINEECEKQGLTHSVILMFDLGDLREGVFNEDEFIDMAFHVENELKFVKLLGIGTNLGCYGSIRPTDKNLGRLCTIAEKIERKIGRRLQLISGGATTSLTVLLDEKMPPGINNLRIGEGILLGRDLEDLWGYDMHMLHKDCFLLKAEVIEVKHKPSYPQGEIFVDAFGTTPAYEDKGIRKRALLAVGKQDFAMHDKLIPKLKGVSVIGSSSDHLIVDITDCEKTINVGDILEFEMFYAPMLYLSASKSVNKIYV